MNQTQWIKSAGGPLICIDESIAHLWRGNSASHREFNSKIRTDYDRACDARNYISNITLKTGTALVLGDMPLETSVLTSYSGDVLIVRLFYNDAQADIHDMPVLLSDSVFDSPDESLIADIASGHMVIFDSVFAGDDPEIRAINFNLYPGQCKILTKKLEPDERTSLLLHKFYYQS